MKEYKYIAHCLNGIYQYDRAVYVNERLANMPCAQAGILKRENGVQLVSFETIVAEIIDGWLHIYGMFSRRTGRHISEFLKQYAPRLSTPYYTAKKLYQANLELNINTLETRKASAGMIQIIGYMV